MASKSPAPKAGEETHFRATAIKHALALEEKKNLLTQIQDLVIECFDLPSLRRPTPAEADQKDIKLFKKALNLFQQKDFDELASERNINDRCGYSLCSNGNRKASHTGSKVWSKEAHFFVDRADYERWCSPACKERGIFVRAQLGTEPAWLRVNDQTDVQLLDEVSQGDNLTDALKRLAISEAKKQELAEKVKELSVERGQPDKTPNEFELIENSGTGKSPLPPSLHAKDSVEGYRPKGTQVSARKLK